ncbi:putative reverse transcriptase domain-containing protein, partial [Tanacetum coccineum]
MDPVEPNQHNDVLIFPELVLVDEKEDPEEDKFKEEEDPQEEDDDMKVDIEEDKNESKLTYPYEEVDPLNPSPPASESEPDDEIEVKDAVESEDETVPASVREVGESSAALFLHEDSDGLLPGLMRRDINSLFGRMASLSRQLCGRETAYALVEKKGKAKDEYYGKLILDLGNEVRSSVKKGTAAMEKLVEKLGNAEDKVECKKLKKGLEEARFSNTFLRMQNERVKRDLYWTRVQAHEFYQEMIRRGFVFKERPNEAIGVSIEDEKSPSSKPRGSPRDSYVDAAIAAERERQANVRNDASRSRLVRGQDTAPAIRKSTFAGFMKCNPTVFCGVEGAGKKVKFAAATLEGPALTWWKTKVATMGLETVNQMPWTEMKKLVTMEFCLIEEVQRIEHELWNLKSEVDAYIRGLTDNIKGEVTSSNPANLNEAVRMAHKLMEQKSQARDERIWKGRSESGRAFKVEIVVCTIKCHKCGKVGHKARYCKEKSVATGANAQPVWTCYDYGEQGHTRNRCPKKIKQEEAGEVRDRAYAIKDAEYQGPNVVT